MEDNENDSHQEPEKKSWFPLKFARWQQAQPNEGNSRPEPTVSFCFSFIFFFFSQLFVSDLNCQQILTEITFANSRAS